MKAGGVVMQSEFIARWADGKRLALIEDGDAISSTSRFFTSLRGRAAAVTAMLWLMSGVYRSAKPLRP